METISLGPGGPVVSRLGFGGCPLGGHGWGDDSDTQEGLKAVGAALDRGITFFDTADVYGLGQSESLLADALGKNRTKVSIASKFGVRWDSAGRTKKDLSPRYLKSALEASLRRLRVEQISLYYAHWPDGVTPVEEVVGQLERCRQEGKIGAIGLSNFPAEDLLAASRVAPIAAVQLQHSLVDREHVERIRSTADQLSTPLVTWGSLAQGLLTGKFDAGTTFPPSDRRSRYENFQGAKFQNNLRVVEELKQVAQNLGKSPAQVAVRWILDSLPGSAVLFGAKRAGQVEDNLGALGWRLADADLRRLNDCGQLATEAAA